ncbi:hypothetical protein FKM82_002222 [Ascaphus truei]
MVREHPQSNNARLSGTEATIGKHYAAHLHRTQRPKTRAQEIKSILKCHDSRVLLNYCTFLTPCLSLKCVVVFTQ